MKKILIILFVFLLPIVGASDITLGHSQCMDFLILNTSVNISAVNLTNIAGYSYIQRVCAPVAVTGGLCEINKTLQPNETYWDLSGVCRVNATCLGEARLLYCPPCERPPEPPGIANFTDIVYPFEENVSFYSNWTDYCHVNLTIAQCPMSRLNIPLNYSIISNEQLNNLTNLAKIGYDCYKDNARLTVDKAKTDFELYSLQQTTCRIDKTTLLKCIDGLANFEREYLEKFAQMERPVTLLEFTTIVAPTVTGEARANLQYYVNLALEDYTECGLAERRCEQIWNPVYMMNITFCSYDPIINSYCLNETASLRSIESGGYWDGVKITMIVGTIFLIIWFVGIWLSAVSPLMPWR